MPYSFVFFFFNDTATTEIYTLSLHDALPICVRIGEITVTAAPAARRPSTLRSATSPPPTTRQRRPASSRKTGKKPISAVHPVRRAAGRDVALHHLNESAREPRAELLVGVAGGRMPGSSPPAGPRRGRRAE